MPDLHPNLTASLLNAVGNDAKNRPAADNSADLGAVTPFKDMIKTDIGTNQKDCDAADDVAAAKPVKAPREAREKDDAPAVHNDMRLVKAQKHMQKVAAAKRIAAVREKIAEPEVTDAPVKADAPQVPMENTKVQEVLKKTAEFLLQAQHDGKITLPKELTEQLQALVAQPDLTNAAKLAVAMRGLIGTFKSLHIILPNSEAVKTADLRWPPEVLDGLKEVGAAAGLSADKPIDIIQALRTLKLLVNESDKQALDTIHNYLQEKIQAPAIPAPSIQAPVAEAQTAENAAAPVVAKTEGEQKTAVITEDVVMPVVAEMATTPTTVKKDDAPAPVIPKTVNKDALIDEAIAAPAAKAEGNAQQGNNDRAAMLAMQASKAPTIEPTVNNAVTTPVDANAINAVAPQGLKAPSVASNPVAIAQAQAQPQLPPSPATQQVMVQIQQKVGNASELKIHLSPAELGQVDVRVSINADGKAHAVIAVDRPETLALLQKDAVHLERILQQAGLNTNLSNMSFNLKEQRQPFQGFSQGRKRAMQELENVGETKSIALNVGDNGQIISDTRINYHA